MIKQLGIPIHFLTFSCADLRWKEFPYIITKLKSLRLNCVKSVNTAFFLVRIFLHLDWILENTDQKKVRIWTLSRSVTDEQLKYAVKNGVIYWILTQFFLLASFSKMMTYFSKISYFMCNLDHTPLGKKNIMLYICDALCNLVPFV